MKRRVLSLILAASLAVSLIPVTVFADTPESYTESQDAAEVSEEAEAPEEAEETVEETTISETPETLEAFEASEPAMLMGIMKSTAPNTETSESNQDGVLTLSGNIAKSRIIPKDENEFVNQVVLSGVTAGDGVEIILKDKIPVIIKEGTTNTLGGIKSDKALTITDSDSDSGSGILNLTYGIVGNEDIIFNHSGSINITNGAILSMKGDIVFNSGTVDVTPLKNATSSQTVAAAGIMALCGEVTVAGGAVVNPGNGKLAQEYVDSDYQVLESNTVINGRTIDFKGATSQSVTSEETDIEEESKEFDSDSIDLEDGTWIELINDLDMDSDAQDQPKGKGQPLARLTGDAQTGEFDFYIRKPQRATYVYRDSDFRLPSTTYNQKLALMSLNLAVAGFGDEREGVKPEDSTHFLEEMFDKIGFSDVFINADYKKESEANSMGVAIAHKKIRGQSVIAVVLRGGGYRREGSGNLNVGNVSEHAGWSIGRNKAIRALVDYMREYDDKISDHPKFWITGYSRGAAVANMTANFMDCALDVASGEATVDSIVPDSDRVTEEKQLMREMSEILKTNMVDYEDIYGYSFGTPAGAFECEEKDASGYTNHNDPDINNIWSQANPEDPVSYVVPEYRLNFYRYGVTMDPRYADVPEGYDSKNIVDPGEDVTEKMLEQLKQIDEEMWRNMSDAPAFQLRTTTIPDVLSLQFGFTEDENHKELTYAADTASSDNADVPDKKQFLETMIKYVVDEIAEGEETPLKLRKHFFNEYQTAFEHVMYMMNDLDSDEKEDFFGTLNEALQDECDILTIIELVSAIIDAEFIEDGRTDAREEPKGILKELLDAVLDNAEESFASQTKMSEYCAMLKTHSTELVHLLYNVIFDDFQKNQLTTLGTALYYGKSLVYSHYPQVAMAYMQAHDEDYVGGNETIRPSGGGGGSTTTIFTGSIGHPVTDGKWIYDEKTGTWSYKTIYKFTETWGNILNPLTHEPGWFYFDRNGNMLTGWQKLLWNGSWKWFYFRQEPGPRYGECQLGGVTPDGYPLNPDGSLKDIAARDG